MFPFSGNSSHHSPSTVPHSHIPLRATLPHCFNICHTFNYGEWWSYDSLISIAACDYWMWQLELLDYCDLRVTKMLKKPALSYNKNYNLLSLDNCWHFSLSLYFSFSSSILEMTLCTLFHTETLKRESQLRNTERRGRNPFWRRQLGVTQPCHMSIDMIKQY